jgi:putative DNA methylase
VSEPYRRKLIEVALPLEAISTASRREKDRTVGTIRNVHKWFAPMPGPALRALLFTALIDDPGDEDARERLLDLVTRLTPDDGGPPPADALAEAKRLIREAFPDPPRVLDPFCGGGSTLVEAQRLGLSAVGSDLNPVAVLISRVLVELLPTARGESQVATSDELPIAGSGLDGFYADLRHYARRVRDRVSSELAVLYPAPLQGDTPIAWLWARTYKCPNPACGAEAPLISSFWLSKQKGRRVWLEPNILRDRIGVEFEIVEHGEGAPRDGTVSRTAATCLVCGSRTPLSYVRAEGTQSRLGVQLMAIAVDGPSGRTYRVPTDSDLAASRIERPDVSDVPIPTGALGVRVNLYGMNRYEDLFTSRQLTMLSAFADSVADVADEVTSDGGGEEYGRAIASVLGLCVGKMAMAHSTQVRWFTRDGPSKAIQAFGRHALPMVWDFAEANPFGGSVGDWLLQLESIIGGLKAVPATGQGQVVLCDARVSSGLLEKPGLICTDPPYFDQIGYADLSDYFYIWLRRALRHVHPDLFATLATPKEPELIEARHRHAGSQEAARRFFVDGFEETFSGLQRASHPSLPIVVVYAHRQAESEDGVVGSTGWDAMLTAMIDAGLAVVGTWPIHATKTRRQIGLGTNALASYIILVCRPRHVDAALASRREFMTALKSELPTAIRDLQHGNIAPVDLAQAAIGPGIAVFSRYAKVVEADGQPMTVRTALGLINQALDEILAEQEGDFDPDTRFAVSWFEEVGMGEGDFGRADVLARAKDTSVPGMERARILVSGGGNVRLLGRSELDATWDPAADVRLTVWEVAHHLIRSLDDGGESSAAELLRRVGALGEAGRELAYRLYAICERKGWAAEALGYNALVVAWPEISRLAAGSGESTQARMDV